MKRMNATKACLILGGMLAGSSVWAGFDLTRMTTVVDDFSGSYTVSKTGRMDGGAFVGNSTTDFANFHPRAEDEGHTIAGVITKSISRGGGVYSTSSDGDVIIANEKNNWVIQFSGLNVVVDEEGALIEGSVNVNGEDYDANELPEGLGHLLRKVFWLTRR